jgi:hypothetical protein
MCEMVRAMQHKILRLDLRQYTHNEKNLTVGQYLEYMDYVNNYRDELVEARRPYVYARCAALLVGTLIMSSSIGERSMKTY